jgi:secretion/DNA translocation related TadE-like protein
VTGHDRGGVSIVMLAVLVVGLVLSTGAAPLGGALVGRARADAAADAAALAAADRLALGDDAGEAVTAARETASSNGAVLVSCACSGTTAEVVVEVGVRGLAALFGPARGHAKAEVRPECVVEAAEC